MPYLLLALGCAAFFGLILGFVIGDARGYDRAQRERKEPLPKSLDWIKVHREKVETQ